MPAQINNPNAFDFPRRAIKALIAVTVAILAGVLAMARAEGASAASRPNFLLIQLDDFSNAHFAGRWIDSRGRQRPAMPIVRSELLAKGLDFTEYQTPAPVCSPSRASMLSGRYSHNHGVRRVGTGRYGGWPAFRRNEILDHNLATWMQADGYQTMHFGKFINNYAEDPDRPTRVVPPGWDEWQADSNDFSTRAYYGYWLNVNGFTEGPFGSGSSRDPLNCPDPGLERCRYHTDAITTRAIDAIEETPKEEPIFAHIGFHTPHGDNRPPAGPEPASRHLGSANGIPRPGVQGFDERDVSDKPVWIRRLPRIDSEKKGTIRTRFRRSVEALRSVDGSIGRILSALRRSGRLDSTFIFFFSDNGYFHGEHRLVKGKGYPYEPAVQVPMFVRGPGVVKGRKSRALVANHDIAPTVLSLAGARADRSLDGRSLTRFFRNPGAPSRRPILLEFFGARGKGTVEYKGGEFYQGVRIGPYKFVRHQTGAVELYHVARDRGELQNLAFDPRYRKVERYMQRLLAKYRGCTASACKAEAPRWPVVDPNTPPVEDPTGTGGGFRPTAEAD